MTIASSRVNRITANGRLIVSLTVSIGLALTLALNSFGAIDPVFQNRSLHAAKETAAALVLLVVAALLFGRFRRSGRVLDLLALAGVVLLAGKGLVFSVLTAILTETSGGLTTWRTTGAGMLGAALLAAAALAPERILKNRRRALALTAGGCLAALGALVAVAGYFDLPAAFTEKPETRAELRYLTQHSALLVADVGATVLFLLAGAAFGLRAERERDEFQLWLGVGAIIAAIAYLNYVLFPSAFTDFLYVGDVFRIVAVFAWGIGTIRAISIYQAGEARAAVLDERRRVARDIHDGVAQELALISSQMQWLEQAPDDPRSRRQIMAAVGRAMEETRGAISALGRPGDEPLPVLLGHVARDAGERHGASVELDIDPTVVVPLKWEEALPRIVRESISNAVRHGHAQTVGVHLRDADGLWLRITDDGEGFDVNAVPPHAGFGLIAMRERTESLGGEFKLYSAPGAGTSVDVMLR